MEEYKIEMDDNHARIYEYISEMCNIPVEKALQNVLEIVLDTMIINGNSIDNSICYDFFHKL